jgi:beta-galactosidase
VIGKAQALTRELVDLVHELDPTRPASVGGAQSKGFDVLGDLAGYNGDGAALFHDPGIPSLVAEYHGAGGSGAGDFDVRWEYGVEADHRWRSGKLLWCAFHYKTIADGSGLYGIVDYFRTPRRPYHWYRQRLRGIEPPRFPLQGVRPPCCSPRTPTRSRSTARATPGSSSSGWTSAGNGWPTTAP